MTKPARAKTRMTKPEARIKPETRMTNDQAAPLVSSFGLRHSGLIRISGFGFRVFLLTCLAPLPIARGDSPAGVLRVLASRHYRIHTDLEPAFAEELARRMDGMYDEYDRRLADFRAAGDQPVFDVYLFRHQSDYTRFAGNGSRNTGGVFMSGKNVLAAFLEGQGRDALRRTLQHEAFHQFAWTAIGPELPVWLNEGMAQLFEEGLWTGQGFLLGQVPPRRVRQLQAELGGSRIIPFRTLLSIDNKTWGENLHRDAILGATQYNQSWAMVHFLVHATDPTGGAKYRARLIKMLKLIHDGEDGERAFRDAFSDNIDGFQARFVEYARALKPTPEATLIDHQDVLADMLVELAERGKHFNDADEFRRSVADGGYRIKYNKAQVQWSTAEDPLVYFCDLTGRPFGSDRLYLSPRTGAVLPDLVCRGTDRFQLRTRFHQVSGGSRVEHETVIDALPGVAGVR